MRQLSEENPTFGRRGEYAVPDPKQTRPRALNHGRPPWTKRERLAVESFPRKRRMTESIRSAHSSKTRSIVELGSHLPLDPSGVIVLNPQLRVVLLQEFFDHRAALRGLFPVGVEGRNFLVRDLFRIVIEIARQQDVPGVGELEKQGLVPGRMTRRGLDDHGPIAKHIMILAVQQHRFAVGEALEVFRDRHAAGGQAMIATRYECLPGLPAYGEVRPGCSCRILFLEKCQVGAAPAIPGRSSAMTAIEAAPAPGA